MITLSIDTNLDAAYIEFTNEPIVETVEVTLSVQVDIDAITVSRIWPSITYASMGQGYACMPTLLQPA